MIHRFQLYNSDAGQYIALVEMDDSLLAPEAGIIDHETGMLAIPDAGQWTLRPVNDHRYNILTRIKDAYETLSKPCDRLYLMQQRMDGVAAAVESLFKPIVYVVVESPDDLYHLVHPSKAPGRESKKVTYTTIDDLLKEVMETQPTPSQPATGQEANEQSSAVIIEMV